MPESDIGIDIDIAALILLATNSPSSSENFT